VSYQINGIKIISKSYFHYFIKFQKSRPRPIKLSHNVGVENSVLEVNDKIRG